MTRRTRPRHTYANSAPQMTLDGIPAPEAQGELFDLAPDPFCSTSPCHEPECVTCGTAVTEHGAQCERCAALVAPLELSLTSTSTGPDHEPDPPGRSPAPPRPSALEGDTAAAIFAPDPDHGRTCPGCGSRFDRRSQYAADHERTYCYAAECTDQENELRGYGAPPDEWCPSCGSYHEPDDHDPPRVTWWLLTYHRPEQAAGCCTTLERGQHEHDPNRGDPHGAIVDELVRPAAQAYADRLGLEVEYVARCGPGNSTTGTATPGGRLPFEAVALVLVDTEP